MLDVRLFEMSGLDFQRDLAVRNIRIPIVFLSDHRDIAMTVRTGNLIWASPRRVLSSTVVVKCQIEDLVSL